VITRFMSYLRSLDVKLWVTDDRLHCSAPKGVLTPALRAELTERKAEVMAFLRSAETFTTPSAPPLRPLSQQAAPPLSFAQQRLWFLDQLQPDSPFYNLPTTWRLTGTLSLPAMAQCLNEIVRRHQVLRTTFATVKGRPFQSIAPTLSLSLPVVDLRELAKPECETHVRQLAMENARRLFDLARDPLLRATLLRLDEKTHVLLLNMHHIVSDGWSQGVFVRELMALYRAFVDDQPSPLPELPIQYADFAAWQREWLQGEVLDRQLSYWKQQLGGPLPTLELPTDHPRPPIRTPWGAQQSLAFSPSLTEALQALSRQEGCTLFMTLLAAFNTLLYRYTAQADILVGSPIANRNRVEVEPLIGFFVNTLTLRTDLSGNPTFRQLLARVRETTLDAYTHQDLPFEKLVEALQPERDLSRPPLFQVMFILQNAPLPSLELPGLTLRSMQVDNGTAKFDLTLSMVETEEGLAGSWEYNTDLFDDSTVNRMAGHFQTLLESIVADPERRIGDLPILTKAERHQLLVEWNDTATQFPQHNCLHELFEAQAERTPDAVAVVFEGQHLTYGELNRRANQLAHFLRALGVQPETRAGICAERSLAMVIGLYGILKAGGAYVPLDPAYPQERLAFMLHDTQVLVILTQERLLERLPEHGTQIICLDTAWETIARKSDENMIHEVKPDHLAYIIYTSGSTGKPKGAMNTHRGICNRLLWMQDTYQLGHADRVMQKTPFSFDVSVWEFFWPLLAGACLVVAQPEGHKNSAYLVKTIVEQYITTMHFVPSMLQVFVEERQVEACQSLKRVICSGEALPFDLQERFFARLGAELHNLYGPTEAAVDVTSWACQRASRRQTVPIGHPIANLQIYLLDRALNPSPAGVPGELYIGGVGLARGYFDRPALTAEKFIPCPFSQEPGARLYRTGDLAHYLPDGAIEFLGRVDHQVKIRGFRIELGEIEAALTQYPAVRETVVLAREDTPGRKQLVAYVVASQEQGPTVSKMHRFLRQKLPDYMVPSAFVTLEALPLTPNGKVDRKALPATEGIRPELAEAFVVPRTPTEKVLAGIWADILGLERIGIHDNFFELGGDSILSIQIVARANQAGLRFTPRQIFEHQTIAEMAAVAETTPEIQAEQGLVTGKVPLTPIQRWFFDQALADPHHFNQAMLLEVRQPLKTPLLDKALQQLLLHHDGLRLRFEYKASGWQQINAGSDGTVPFTCIDLSALQEVAQSAAIEREATRLQASLNLSAGPLMRVALFDLGEQRPGRLLIVIHHLAVDGVSWRILLEDLETAYRQLSRGEAITLPPKTTSFKQWAERLVAHARSEKVKQELDKWLVKPSQTIPPLPVDHPGGDNTAASTQTMSVASSVEETQALLREVPRAYRTQINDVLLTALAQAFAQWTGQDALLVDLEGHGREDIFDEINLSRTVGWFTSVFPVRLDLEEAQEPKKALKLVKEQLHRIPHRGINYGVLRYLSESAQLWDLPQSEVIFNYLGQLDQVLPESSAFELAPESKGPHQSPRGKRRYLLEINGSIKGGQLQLDWTYSENVHRRSTIERLAQEFVKRLRAIIAHCQSPEAGGYTPSDFPDVELTQEKLDKALAEILLD